MASIKRKDLEAISAYIDQVLDPRELARLEERLRREPDLLAELNSMRQTRRILRSTPALRAPRNFTLTPEMVDVPAVRTSRLLPVTRFAFALTSILFVFALVGNFTIGQLAGAQSQDVAALSMPAAEEVQVMEAPAEEAPIAPEIESMDEAEQGDAAEMPAAERVVIETESAIEPPTPDPGLDMPSGVVGLSPEPTPEPLTEPAPEVVAESEELEVAAAPMEDVASVPLEDVGEIGEQAGDIMEESAKVFDDEGAQADAAVEKTAAASQDAPRDTSQPGVRLNSWLIAAIISGLLAVISGGLALVFRRK